MCIQQLCTYSISVYRRCIRMFPSTRKSLPLCNHLWICLVVMINNINHFLPVNHANFQSTLSFPLAFVKRHHVLVYIRCNPWDISSLETWDISSNENQEDWRLNVLVILFEKIAIGSILYKCDWSILVCWDYLVQVRNWGCKIGATLAPRFQGCSHWHMQAPCS